MDECTQVVGTQDIYDPRRTGRNNSGLSDADIADVLCILHPATPAAFRVVRHTAQRAPEYVLQNNSFTDHYGGSQHNPEEAETFILGTEKPYAMDLALRFSAHLNRPELGFVFGRNVSYCDVVLDGDTSRRISNLHFRIFINNQGVLMLEDASTNGTLVDDNILHGRPEGKKFPGPPQRMLISGSVIQIVSPKADEIIKFILRIPHREGHEEQFKLNFHAFVAKCWAAQVEAEDRERGVLPAQRRLFPSATKLTPTSSTNMRAPTANTNFGMHWSGGDKYSTIGIIGKGAFACVYQVATKADGMVYAAKELDKRRCMKNGVFDRKITTEMQIMQTVKHPSIVNFVDYMEYDNWMYIIMEFVTDGDLQQHLQQHGELPEPVAKLMGHQVLSALDYLHQNKITHRDIKPDNILIADNNPETFTIKLSDFGLSKVVQDDKDTFLKTFCGTLLYCAPEVFPHYDNHVAVRGKKRQRGPGMPQPKTFHSYSQSVDIWSFAAVLWYSMCLTPPFEGVADNTGKGMFDKIMMTPLDTAVLSQKAISVHAIDLLRDMLNTDPAARPTPGMCLRHKWFGGDGVAPQPDAGLGAIAEERDADAPDVASLSLVEQPVSQDSQLSLNSGDILFFDPRQSKRFKSNVFDKGESSAALDSSPEVIFDRMPIANQVSVQQMQPPPSKLFGEISQSALNARRISNDDQDATLSFNSDDEEAAMSQLQSQRAKAGITSLLGAESLVRDLKVASPAGSSKSSYVHSHDGFVIPSASKDSSAQNSTSDVTPKAKSKAPFDRRINLPYPPSLYWDAHDPSTHTLEYASKVSGHDFTREASITFPLPPLPDRTGSLTDTEDTTIDQHARSRADSAWRTPAMRSMEEKERLAGQESELEEDDVALEDLEDEKPELKLGTLVTTAESFMKIQLTLSKKREDWGRAPTNTHVYPDGYDTRIPKRAIIIWFFATGLDQYEDDDEAWTLLPDLQACVMTEKRSGITVNGVHLPTNELDIHPIIKLYTGDVIEVYSREGQAPLRFICDFYHGIGRQSRPQNVPTTLVRVGRDKRSESPSWRSERDKDQARPGSSWSG